ncbi:MAG: hypothetical protein U0807_15790 [Candidatus Binatia bacterium]
MPAAQMGSATAEIVLPARGRFDLRATVLSHGPMPHAPWQWHDGVRPLLRRAERLADGSVYLLAIRPAPAGVVLRATGPDANEIERLAPLAARIRRALRLDEDLTSFHRLCRTHPGLRPIARAGLGRLLRGTTLFEDLVKAIVWRGRTGAGAATIGHLGTLGSRCAARPGLRAFPTPDQIAQAGAAPPRAQARLGSRAVSIKRIARGVADGTWDLAELDAAADRLPSATLVRRLRALPGIGPAAAAWMLLVLGHYDRPAIDAATLRWVRGSEPPVLTAAAWGAWRGLALWWAQCLGLDARTLSAVRRPAGPDRRARRR